VFTRAGTVWTQQQHLTAGDAAAFDQFGHSVALSSDGTTAIVGSWNDSVGASYQGSAYVFTRSGVTWTQQQQLTAADAATFDYFGGAVGISSDGNTAIVGALGDLVNSPTQGRGAAYVFTALRHRVGTASEAPYTERGAADGPFRPFCHDIG